MARGAVLVAFLAGVFVGYAWQPAREGLAQIQRDRPGQGDPALFRGTGPQGTFELPIVYRETIAAHRLQSGRWPFSTADVLLACADGAFNIARIGERYFGLNGNTTQWRDKMQVVLGGGSKRAIFTSERMPEVHPELLLSRTTIIDINEAFSALNARALEKCRR